MLTTNCIENIKAVPVSEVVGNFIKLKKSGAGFTANCPFHSEKTSSFHVSDSKDIYKCFGCGKSGDVISFVMEHEKMSFTEACEKIAQIGGFELEYEYIITSEEQKKILTAAQEQEQVLNYVIPIYRDNLLRLPADHPARVELYDRGFDTKEIQALNLGWAGENWNSISSDLINKGWYNQASKLGIIKRSLDGESNYDGYRSRITYPIKDRNGKHVGLAGRYVKVSEKDSSNIPKWINPADCELYNKSHVLYGLDRAAQHIRKHDHAILVEGYMDVDTPHALGIKNVVGICGTAFTVQQMRVLKKYTSNILMMLDNDKAGIAAFNKLLPLLLKEDFKVDVFVYPPDSGEIDPDKFFRSLNTYHSTCNINFDDVQIQDAVTYRITDIWAAGNYHDDVYQIAQAKTSILELIAHIKNQFLQKQFLERFISLYRWKASEINKQFPLIAERIQPEQTESPESDNEFQFPSWVSPEQRDNFFESGFLALNKFVNGKRTIGYHSFNAAGKIQITNFLVYPLFHVYAGVESHYLLQVDNGNIKAVLDVPARVIPSPEQFQAIAVSEGPFMIFGSKTQWLRIAADLLGSFPRCIELINLGWQNSNCFTWVDKVYMPGEGIKDLDNWGIFKHKGENFLIPANCEAYRQLQKIGEDPFENTRYLTYKQSPVSFSRWAEMMNRVYSNKQGLVAVAYVILTLFRDIVFSIDNNCPHLWGFGEPSSGKSKWAESIYAAFYFGRSAFNVNHGTDNAFFTYMQRFMNCPAFLNEFNIETMKFDRFEAVKGIFDGEGRERGKSNGRKNSTEIMRVKSTLILIGQKLVTADDNSVVTRSIIEPFSIRTEYAEDDRKAYEELKSYEKQGLSSMLVEIIAHRDFFVKSYPENFRELLANWRLKKRDNSNVNQRILQNYAHLVTCYNMISKHITLPVPAEEFQEYAYSQVERWSSFVRTSDTLSEFWNTLEFLIDELQVARGWDFLIEEQCEIKIRKNKDEETVPFNRPRKVLYLRLNNIHKKFQAAFRTRTGKEAMNMENLIHYFSSRPYYLGPVKRKLFKRFINHSEVIENNNQFGPKSHVETGKREDKTESSCYAFYLDELEIQIDRMEDTSPSR